MTANAPDLPSHVTPELLEQWRTIGLRLDRQGRFWHQAARVEHHRLHVALLRWLAQRDDGRYIVRLDDLRYAYVEVEDVPLRVVSFRAEDGAATISLDDETQEPLACDTLTSPDGAQIYARVRGQSLWARFASSAHQALVPFIEPSTGDESQYAFVLDGKRWPVRMGAPS